MFSALEQNVARRSWRSQSQVEGAQVLRRTFNTLMVEAAVDRAVLWSMIGHSDERQSRRYAGVSLDAKADAVQSEAVQQSLMK